MDLQIIPACKNNVEAQYVDMMVPLYSHGCEKKVKKALSNLKGIYSVNVYYNKQKVTVWGICNKNDVLETIKSKRRGARFWNPTDNINHNNNDNDNIESLSDNGYNNDELQNDHESSSPTIISQYSLAASKRYYNSMKRSLALTRVRSSLSWKTVKKVFARSHSF